MSDFVMDWDRSSRTGVAEAILCDRKSTVQIANIVGDASSGEKRLLLTRLSEEQFEKLPSDIRVLLEHDRLSDTAILGGAVPLLESGIGIVTAGTSDLPVAREALRTLNFAGYGADLVADVGVAGLSRLLQRLDTIRRYRIIIAAAGMEGALFSVLAGLVEAPVIAVPTSVGYGVATGGTAALSSALASCAPGVMVVNIDNGFGAAAAAMKILRMFTT